MHFVILGLLLAEQLSLYDVKKRFGAGISLFYSASSGSIERALSRLVEENYAVVEKEPDSPRRKKLYVATDTGRSAWLDWMKSPLPSSLDAETATLAKIYLLGRVDDSQDRIAVLDSLHSRAAVDLDGLRALEREVTNSAVQLPPAAADIFRYQFATLSYGIRAHELTLRWIDELRKKEMP
jgi:DNA-binding PadR family transcriptional regulator